MAAIEHRHIVAKEWDALATDPAFLALQRSRRRFTLPATLFFIAYYLALPCLVGFAPDFMSRPVWGPLTLAYCFALSQFAMAWILLAVYLIRARHFDRQAAAVRELEVRELAQ